MMNTKDFELQEVLQVDKRTWLRILLAVVIFLFMALFTNVLIAFVPIPLPTKIVGVLFGTFLLFGTFKITFLLYTFFGLDKRTNGIKILLNEDTIKVFSPKSGKTITLINKNIRLVRTRKFLMEIVDDFNISATIPIFVNCTNLKIIKNELPIEDCTALEVINAKLYLVERVPNCPSKIISS